MNFKGAGRWILFPFSHFQQLLAVFLDLPYRHESVIDHLIQHNKVDECTAYISVMTAPVELVFA